LTVSVTVEGSVENPLDNRYELVKWSTRRIFDATVEMEAGKPDKYSLGEGPDGAADAQQTAAVEMAKQAEACLNPAWQKSANSAAGEPALAKQLIRLWRISKLTSPNGSEQTR